MPKEKAKFSPDVKIKALLWCDRHCCLCKKTCGTDIEVAHIDQKLKVGLNGIDNAIPLCYDCHARIGRYNREHPRGNKFSSQELKARREQVYEEFTRHLMPPVNFKVTQISPSRTLPDIGFVVANYSDYLSVGLRATVGVFLGGKSLGFLPRHYSGAFIWNLNPRSIVSGHALAPKECADSMELLEVKVHLVVIDQFERNHELLPFGYVYLRDQKDWYFEPSIIAGNQLPGPKIKL